ncbi:MAG: DUF4097 domain-containing protein [Acidobacteria bacterium]|nr:DUF4097 domain-containing protein [Acidobacteriota bacterium]
MMTKKWIVSAAALTFLGMLLLSIFLSAGIADTYEEKFTESVALSRTGKVDLSNVSGDIVIHTWGQSEVKIDARKIGRASSESLARENVGKVKIEIDKNGDTLSIKTVYPKNTRNINVTVHYELTIPDGASVKASSVSGNVEASDIGGSAKLTTVSGNVEAKNIKGFLNADSVSGSVVATTVGDGANVHSVSGDLKIRNVVGDVDGDTVSGSVFIEGVKGSVSAKTISGDTVLSGIEDATTVKASSLSGSVQYEGDILSGGSYSFKAHSGRVVLDLPSDAAFDLSATTFSGSIRSDFEITMSGQISKKSIRGAVNGGGAEVKANSFSGSIHIRKK